MITKERITSIISKVPFNANELLSYLKNNEYLKTLYETRYRHYLLEEHTLLVIKQFQLYFSAFLPDAEKSFMYLMLAFHDIGKPLSIKSQQSQYKSTISVIDSLKDYLPVILNSIVS
jgi:hypothetical protein